MLDDTLVRLINERILLDKKDILELLRRDMDAIESRLAEQGALYSGARGAQLTARIAQATRDLGEDVWSVLSEVMSEHEPVDTAGLADQLKGITREHIGRGFGSRILADRLANTEGGSVDHGQRELARARKRTMRSLAASIDLYVSAQKHARPGRWFARRELIPTWVMVVAVLLAAVIPQVVDVPWRFSWGREVAPESSVSTRLHYSAPDSIDQTPAPDCVPFSLDEAMAFLEGDTGTDFQKTAFKAEYQGKPVRWSGVLVSAWEMTSDAPEGSIGALICPLSAYGILVFNPVAVTFEREEWRRLARVASDTGVTFRGVLDFSEHFPLPHVRDARLISSWSLVQDALGSG